MAKVANRERAVRRMRAIGPKVRRAVRAQNNANAAELVQMQRRLAPKDEGDLAATVRHEDVSDATRIAQRIQAGGPATTKPVRNSEKGSAPDYDYANAVEHGTEDTPAQPFFFPSYRAKRKRFKSSLTRAAKKAVAEGVSTS